MSVGLLWILFLVGIFLYFLPTGIAMARNCQARSGIEIVNLFLGWTFVGWVVALAWAASGEQRPRPLPAEPRSTESEEELRNLRLQVPIR